MSKNVKRTNKIDDGLNGDCLSTNIANCRKAVAFCNKRAVWALLDSERDRWFELAARNYHRAEAIARGEA